MGVSDPTPPREKLSHIPSWIMVGFVCGCVAVLGIQSEVAKWSPPPPEPPTKEEPKDAKPAEKSVTALADRPSLSVLEAVFSQWGEHAIWDNDITEVALWNSATGTYSDFFEVIRSGGIYYFRSITRLTRPIFKEGTPANSPLLFTEFPPARGARRSGARVEPTPPPASSARPATPTPAPAPGGAPP